MTIPTIEEAEATYVAERPRGAKPGGPLRLLRHITGIATKRYPSTRVFGSHVVLDDGRSRKQTARFQDLLQQQSHAYLTGRANAGYAPVTANRQSPLVSMATSLSGPLSDTGGCLISQRFALATVSSRPLQKPGMKSPGLCVRSCTALRGSDRFTAAVSIRQRQAWAKENVDLTFKPEAKLLERVAWINTRAGSLATASMQERSMVSHSVGCSTVPFEGNSGCRST